MKTERFYTVKTLAERLAVKPLTIYRLVDQGKLPAVRIGRSIRFDPDAVAAFLESVRIGPGGLKEGKPGRAQMGKTDVRKFWQLLTDPKFTGQPSQVTEDEIRQMTTKLGWHGQDIEAAIQGLRDYLEER